MNETNILFFSLIGGVIPAFFWLWFWIREDRLRPEPKSALFSAFIGGILAVLFAIFFELIFYYLLVDASHYHLDGLPEIFRNSLESLANKFHLADWQFDFWNKIQNSFDKLKLISSDLDIKKSILVIIIAPLIEETLKLTLTYNICLRRKVNDEPIDASIYMLTTALGFAAVETAIFLTEPLSHGNILDTLVASNFRSIGPMLIHLISSAMLGLFIGFAFYKSKIKKIIYLFLGWLTAIILHSLFNLFIILNDSTHNGLYFWTACLGTWTLVIVLLVLFEKIKKLPLTLKNIRKI